MQSSPTKDRKLDTGGCPLHKLENACDALVLPVLLPGCLLYTERYAGSKAARGAALLAACSPQASAACCTRASRCARCWRPARGVRARAAGVDEVRGCALPRLVAG